MKLQIKQILFVLGLKVEGLYRRCGVAPQISKLVDSLRVSPGEVVLGTDENSILDVTGALKRILRQTFELMPQKQLWLKAAGGRLTETQRKHLYIAAYYLRWL